MKKLIFFALVFILNIFILGCEKEDELIQASFLKMKWIESYEEKTSEEIEIYRQGNLEDFPPSRYRQVFNFGDSNKLEYRVLAANDAHYMTSGSWEIDYETKIIKVYNSDSEKIYEFEIAELTDQVLKLKVNN